MQKDSDGRFAALPFFVSIVHSVLAVFFISR